MKIALAQLNYRVGDFGHNVSLITETIEKAKSLQAGLVVFAELSVCGYPPRDFLEFNDFIRRCDEAVVLIASKCHGIAAIVGAPSLNPAPKGKPLYNSAYFLADGKILAKANKTLLPNYDVFDEYRYFEPNRLPYSIVTYKGHRIALTICEDLWNIADDPLYIRNPMDELVQLNPDVVVNIAASPFNYHQQEFRRSILVRNAQTYNLPVIYVNQVGGQTELIFDGGSMVVDDNGDVVAVLKEFEEDFFTFELQNARCKIQNPKPGLAQPAHLHSFKSLASPDTIRLIYAALLLGIKDYFGKMGFSRAILGLSGGIDSAVTLVLAAYALGSENIRAILLPSQFSSDHSISDAVLLAENLSLLGCKLL